MNFLSLHYACKQVQISHLVRLQIFVYERYILVQQDNDLLEQLKLKLSSKLLRVSLTHIIGEAHMQLNSY